MMDVGAPGPVFKQGRHLVRQPEGLVEGVGGGMRKGVFRIQRWRGVQMVGRGVEEGIVSCGGRVGSVTTEGIEVVVRVECRHIGLKTSDIGHQSMT